MVFIYIQTLQLNLKRAIPYRIFIKNDLDEQCQFFRIRPEISISKKVYEQHQLDRLEILASPPFCDIADELIELFEHEHLVFNRNFQYLLLKSQFRTIGYNFKLKPKIVWDRGEKAESLYKKIEAQLSNSYNFRSKEFGAALLNVMQRVVGENEILFENYKEEHIAKHQIDLSTYKKTAGVYFFMNEADAVIYVGKAKSVRKRLQSHFSNSEKKSTIDYAQVASIDVVYTGNDSIAQLVETENIKRHKPQFNSQQVNPSKPFQIALAETANGIKKLKIVRKDFVDGLPEKYFNRSSVLKTLVAFCAYFKLCRKHCGIERVKGACSNVTKKNLPCVCNKEEAIDHYNKRFEHAFKTLRSQKIKKIYKLKGRNSSEDGYVYEVNGIYEGYGFIDKSLPVSNINDILSTLNPQENNYETARILDAVRKSVARENVLAFE